MTRPLLFGLLAAIAVGAFAVPAGNDQPLIVRVVTIGDRTGPAFYSTIEEGYRFIASPSLLAASRTATQSLSDDAVTADTKEMVTAEVETPPVQ